MKKVKVDFRSIAVEGCHQAPQPVIYLVTPNHLHRRDVLFRAFVDWKDAVDEKDRRDGHQIMKVLLQESTSG